MLGAIVLVAAGTAIAALPSPARAQATPAPICSRNAEVQAAILARLPSGTDCAAVTSEQLAGITGSFTITIDTAPPSAGTPPPPVAVGDLDGLSGVTNFTLAGSALTSVPAGIFQDMRSVTGMTLGSGHEKDGVTFQGSPLTTIVNNQFSGLSNLQDLGFNFMSSLITLEPQAFAGLSELTSLNMTHTSISQLHSTQFTGLTKLKTLWMNHNQIRTLPAGLFTDQSALTVLRLWSNQIALIEPGAFTGLTAVTGIYLNDNQLSTIPSTLFSPTTRLAELWLHDNNLARLPDDSFSTLSNLGLLRLEDNRISTLSARTFTGLIDLGDLRLQDNQIRTIERTHLSPLLDLGTLRLDGNAISTLPSDLFDDTPSLRSVNLSDNQIASWPTAIFANNSSLQEVMFARNHLTSVTRDHLRHMNQLRILDLEGNGLTSISTDLFLGLATLRKVNLSRNNIFSLPPRPFPDTPELEELRLNDNLLRTLVGTEFTGHRELHLLDLSNNRITTFPAGTFDSSTAFQPERIGVKIYLSNTGLQMLPDGVFAGIRNLQSVFLNFNQLTALPPRAFEGVVGLTNEEHDEHGISNHYVDLRNNLRPLTIDYRLVVPDQSTVPLATGNSVSSNNRRRRQSAIRVVAVQGHVVFEQPTLVATNGYFCLDKNSGGCADNATTISDHNLSVGDLQSDIIYVFRTNESMPVTVEFEAAPPQKVLYVRSGLESTVGDPIELFVAPSAPRELITSNQVRGQTVLSWQPPLSDGGKRLTGYQVELSADGNDDSWNILADDTGTTDTSYTHLDPPLGETVYYRVRAINDIDLTGDASDAATGTAVASSVPNAPTGLTATGGQQAIELIWQAPADKADADPVAGYRIQFSTDAGVTWDAVVEDTESLSTSYVHTGLGGGLTLHYRVAAINSGGISDNSNEVEATTEPATVPEAPTELMATGGDQQIHLTWLAPVNDGGADVEGYRVQRSNDGLPGTWFDLESFTESTDTEYTHSGLTPLQTVHYRVRAVNRVGASEPSNATSATTIEKPSIAFTSANFTAAEGGDDALVTLQLSAAPSSQLRLPITLTASGTAALGDWSVIVGGRALSGNNATQTAATFEAGETEVTIIVRAVDDAEWEGAATEQVAVALRTPLPARVSPGSPLATTVTLTDNDPPPTVTLVASSIRQPESDATPITITVQVGGSGFAEARAITVAVGGSATQGTDYTVTGDLSIDVPANATAGTSSLSIALTDDTDTMEGLERIVFTGTIDGPGSLLVDRAEVIITDDESPPAEVLVTLDTDRVNEGDTGQTISVTVSFPTGSGLFSDSSPVTIRLVDDTATSTFGGDYRGVSNVSANIPANQATASAAIQLNTEEDTVVEGDEAVAVEAEVRSLTGRALITIVDNDVRPTRISLRSSPSAVDEDAGDVDLDLTAAFPAGSPTLTEDVAISLRTAEITDAAGMATETTAIENIDFSSVVDTLTILAGQTRVSKRVTLTVLQDVIDDDSEQFQVTGAAGGFEVLPARITIDDEDARPRSITLTTDTATVTEDANPTLITITATVDGRTTFDHEKTVTVDVSSSSLLGIVGFLAAPAEFEIQIPAGSRSGTGRFRLTPTADELDGVDNSIQITGRVADDRAVTVTATTVTLTDDDEPSTNINLIANVVTLTEETAAATAVTVTAAVDGPSVFNERIRVRVSVAGETGIAYPVEFTADPANFNIDIPRGERTATGIFTVTITDNSTPDTTQTVTISGRVPGRSDLTVGTDTFTIEDADPTPSIVLTNSVTAVHERADVHAVVITANLQAGATFATEQTLALTVTGGNGATAADFSIDPLMPEITIAAGATAPTTSISLTVVEDSDSDSGETLIIGGTLSGRFESVVVTPTTITLTDDPPGTIELSADPTTVQESADPVPVTVTATLRPRALSTDATLTATVVRAELAHAVQFTANPTTFEFVIPAGDTTATASFDLNIVDNALNEFETTATINAVAPPHTVVPVILRVTDDDLPPIVLSVSPNSFGEGGAATPVDVTATIMTDGPLPSIDVPVTVSVTGVEAIAGADFTAIDDFTITITRNTRSGMHTITLDVVDDSDVEGAETMSVTGVAAGHVVEPATITIVDNETLPTSITLSVIPTAVTEGAPLTEVVVTAQFDTTAALSQSTTVAVSIAGGTAAVGDDFTADSSLTITIPAGTDTGSGLFLLTALADDVAEAGGETVTVSGLAAPYTVNAASINLTDRAGAADENLPIRAKTLWPGTASGGQLGWKLNSTDYTDSRISSPAFAVDGVEHEVAEITYDETAHTLALTISPPTPVDVSNLALDLGSRRNLADATRADNTFTWSISPGDLMLTAGQAIPLTLTRVDAPVQFSTTDPIARQTWLARSTLEPFTVPTANRGNRPFTYRFEPRLPLGVAFDVDGTGPCQATVTVCGAPRAQANIATYRLIAEDVTGDTAALTMDVTIQPPLPMDINADQDVDANDMLVLYYALALPQLLGDGGELAGMAYFRHTFLAQSSAPGELDDDDYQAYLRTANTLPDMADDTAWDINDDGRFDEYDALILYVAYALPELVGTGEADDGFAYYRWALLTGLVPRSVRDDDAQLRQILQRARAQHRAANAPGPR